MQMPLKDMLDHPDGLLVIDREELNAEIAVRRPPQPNVHRGPNAGTSSCHARSLKKCAVSWFSLSHQL